VSGGAGDASGFIDLHCHCLPAVDDGAATDADSRLILGALGQLGFELVVATPHMRPGLYDRPREELAEAFARMQRDLVGRPGMPRVELGCEHYLDDVVLARLLAGNGLPLPGDRAVLIELWGLEFPWGLEPSLAELRRRHLLPIVAHPERYQWAWRDPEPLERVVDAGAAMLLNAASLAGTYGKKVERCAEQLLELGLYHATCSDAHHPDDVAALADGMQRIRVAYGQDELDFLLRDGPRELLAGRVPE
jgi:protein-tyrosine phosphatase